MENPFNISFKRVGGMRFLRIGQLQISWCIVTGASRKAKLSRKDLAKAAYFRGYDRALARFGWNYQTRASVVDARKVVEASRALREIAAAPRASELHAKAFALANSLMAAPTVARWLPGEAITADKPFYHRTAVMTDGSLADFAV